MTQNRAPEVTDIRSLAIAFTTAVATAGRLAEELDTTVNDLQSYLDKRDLPPSERRDPHEPYTGEERRRR